MGTEQSQRENFLSSRQDSDRWWGHGRVSERKRTKETRSTRLVYPKGRSNKSHRPKVDSLEETPPCRFCVGPAHAWWGITPPCPMIRAAVEGSSPPTNSPSRLPLHIRIPPPSPPTTFFLFLSSSASVRISSPLTSQALLPFNQLFS